jgi:hypothetical protein
MGPMVSYNAISGISTMRFTAYIATGATPTSNQADAAETDGISWHALSELPRLAMEGHIQDGPSLTALCYMLSIGGITNASSPGPIGQDGRDWR